MLSVAYVLVGISIALLAVYGADVAVTEATGEGFLDIDHKARGIGFGMPSIILPFVAFILARKEPSMGLGAMIIVAGALIIIGGAAVLGLAEPPEPDSVRNPIAEAVPLLIVGAIIAGLGAFKIARSRQ